MELRRSDITPALIIDEAQSLPHELLEEIRLLANIETTTEKLLPIVLAGQPELADRLNHTSLRQLKQRIGLRCQLKPLDLRETAAYITARIGVAGGTASSLFTRDAVILVHERAQGIPRLISVICHNSLISAFALSKRPISADVVREVCEDFDLKHVDAMGTFSTSFGEAATGDGRHPVDVIRQSSSPENKPGRDMFTGLVRPRRW